MKPLTQQQIFNRAAKHLMTQRKSSIDDDGSCLYRGPDGLRCAVGIFIKDSAYDETFEGGNLDRGEVQEALLASGIEAEAFDLLKELQDVHDGAPPSDWKKGLAKVAKNFDLKTTVLDGFKSIRKDIK